MEDIDVGTLINDGRRMYARWLRLYATEGFTATGFVVSYRAHGALRRSLRPGGGLLDFDVTSISRDSSGMTLCGLPVIASDVVPDGEIRMVVV